MKKRWFALLCLAGLLVGAVWSINVWNDRRKLQANEQKGRAIARSLINSRYLHIELGQGKAWRPTFERLMSERYGLKFPVRRSGANCGGTVDISDESMAEERAFMEVMRAEVERRFEPGVLEQIAEDAQKICQEAEQAAASNPY